MAKIVNINELIFAANIAVQEHIARWGKEPVAAWDAASYIPERLLWKFDAYAKSGDIYSIERDSFCGGNPKVAALIRFLTYHRLPRTRVVRVWKYEDVKGRARNASPKIIKAIVKACARYNIGDRGVKFQDRLNNSDIQIGKEYIYLPLDGYVQPFVMVGKKLQLA